MKNFAPVSDISPMPARVPLRETAALLAELCHRLDDGEDPHGAIAQIFQETVLELAEAIDRRKAFIAVAEAHAKTAREQAKALQTYARKIDDAVKALKERTLSVMQDHPGLPYRDSFGRKLSICPASQPKLTLSFQHRLAKKTVSHVIDRKTAEEYGVPAKYLTTVAYEVVDMDALRADLANGVQYPWAHSERTPYVKGL